MIEQDTIWDLSCISDRDHARLEFPDLIRFKGNWYCAFREADLHNGHPSGRVRLLRSTDGIRWTTAMVFDWDDADVRDPKLSVTSEGLLMVNTSIVFGTFQMAEQPERYKPKPGAVPDEVAAEMDFTKPVFVPHASPGWKPEPIEAEGVRRHSVTWLSTDGLNWSGAHACPSGINTWRWAVTWHGGMGYSVAYENKGLLFRTRDGKNWRLLKDDLFPDEEGERGNEASLAFTDDGTALCLLRCHPFFALLGKGQSPHYQDWQWHRLSLNPLSEAGNLCPAEEKLGVQMGGPKLLRLNDGRFVAAGRTDAGGVRGEETETAGPARIGVFELDPDKAVLNEWAEIDAASYPGVVEHDGTLWMSYGRIGASQIFIGRMKLPR